MPLQFLSLDNQQRVLMPRGFGPLSFPFLKDGHLRPIEEGLVKITQHNCGQDPVLLTVQFSVLTHTLTQ